MLTVILNKKVERDLQSNIKIKEWKQRIFGNALFWKTGASLLYFFSYYWYRENTVFEKSHSLSYLWVFKYPLVPPGEALPAQHPLPIQSSYYKKKKNSVITSFSPPVFKDPIQLLPRLQKLCLTPAVPTYPTPSLPQSMFPQSHRHSHQHTPTKLTSFSAFCFLLPQYHVHFLLYFTLFFLSLIFLNFFIFELKDKSFTEVRAGT